MRSIKKPTGQLHFLAPTLKEQLNPKNELSLLSDELDWDYFEKEFAPMYSEKGRPAHVDYLTFLGHIFKDLSSSYFKIAIEPIIGHLKSDDRAARNFLKGQIGDSINFIMAAAGFNFRKLMNKLKQIPLWLFTYLKNILNRELPKNQMTFT